MPQRPELAVVVPISTEASREASVVVSCGCFWPFLGVFGSVVCDLFSVSSFKKPSVEHNVAASLVAPL